MSWVTVASIDTNGLGNTRLQYDDSSTGDSRTARVIFELNAGASIWVYFNNFTVNGTNYGQKTVTGNCTLWEGSLPSGNRTVSYTCPWYSGSVNYSGTGYIPSGIVAPSGLSITLKSKTYNSATFATSISSYGTPSNSDGRYIEAAILNQNSYGSSYRYATARNTTSATIAVSNSSSANPSSFNIEGNHKYWYGCYASNTRASSSKVAGTFYTPCPPLSSLSYSSQSYLTYNTVNAVITYQRQADGGAETRTGYYRYSTDGGENYSDWISFGAVSVVANTAATFSAILPTDSNIILQAKLSTPNGGDSEISSVSFSTIATHQAPNFSDFEYHDINSTTIALTGDNQAMIQGQSTPQITISVANKATGNDGVAITDYAATLAGVSKTFSYSDSAIITALDSPNESGTGNLTVSAIDALSASTAVSKPVTIYPWAAPTISASIERINNFESDSVIKASGTYSPIEVNNVAQNTLRLEYRYKKTSSSEWSSWYSRTVNVNGNSWSVTDFTVSLNNEYQWNIQVRIIDAFTNATVDLSISTGVPIFRIGTDGYVYNNEKRLITIDEAPKYSTHVGQVIQSTTLDTAAKVQAIYGGTWRAWGAGRVPVGVDTSDSDFNTAGKTGGVKEVTLNSDNLPERAMVRQQVSGTRFGCPCNSGITNSWANICMRDGGFDHSKPLSILQPYSTVYMWERIA